MHVCCVWSLLMLTEGGFLVKLELFSRLLTAACIGHRRHRRPNIFCWVVRWSTAAGCGWSERAQRSFKLAMAVRPGEKILCAILQVPGSQPRLSPVITWDGRRVWAEQFLPPLTEAVCGTRNNQRSTPTCSTSNSLPRRKDGLLVMMEYCCIRPTEARTGLSKPAEQLTACNGWSFLITIMVGQLVLGEQF